MEVQNLTLEVAQSLTLPMPEVQLMPIGDIQLGSNGVDLDRLKRQLEWSLKMTDRGDPPIYYLGMGDFGDLLSPSNRQIWAGTGLYDSAQQAMDAAACQLEDELIAIFAGTEGRWLGIHEGHHYFEHADGSTTDTRIAAKLGAPFLGTMASTKIELPGDVSCTVLSAHGWGSGKSPMSPINALMPVYASFDADIYLMGHHTKKPVVKMPRLVHGGSKNVILAGTGGFTKGYEYGSKNLAGRPQGSYVEKGGMTPATLGSILIKIRPDHGRVDMNVEV